MTIQLKILFDINYFLNSFLYLILTIFFFWNFYIIIYFTLKKNKINTIIKIYDNITIFI